MAEAPASRIHSSNTFGGNNADHTLVKTSQTPFEHRSNTGQALVKHQSNTGQNRSITGHTPVKHQSNTDQTPAKCRSKKVKHWSNTGQTPVKHHSNASGAASVGPAPVEHGRRPGVADFSQTGGEGGGGRKRSSRPQPGISECEGEKRLASPYAIN